MKTMKAVAAAAVILAGTIGFGIGTAGAGEGKAGDAVPTVQAGGIAYRVGIDSEGGGWNFRAALETGAVATAANGAQGIGGRAADASVPTVASGGLVYRVGIDTQ